MRCVPLFAAFLFSWSLLSQAPALGIEKIMEGERFIGFLPESPFWSEDGQFIYFSWNPGMDTLRSLYKVPASGGDPRQVSPEEQRFLSAEGEYSPGRNWKVFEKYGDIFLLDRKQFKTLRLTNTSEIERRPVFCGNESTIVYQRGHNLFAWDKATGATIQLTPFQTGNPTASSRKGDAEAWLEKDQLAYFEVLRKRKAVEEARKKQLEEIEPAAPKTIYLENRNLQSWQVSPDLRFVVFRLQSNGNANSTKVPVFVTESGHVEFPSARAKVGAAQERFQSFVYDRVRDTCYVLNLDSLPGIFDKPAFLQEYHQGSFPFASLYDSARPTIVHGPYFSEKGLAVAEVKALDNKDRWIVLIDLGTGLATSLDRQHDDAWIGGPGISGWNFSAGKLDWADDRHIFFHSEETGYSHLYLLNVHTREKKALTSGNFEIIHADLSADKKFFYLTSNKESPHERHFYRLPLSGGKMEKLTGGPGNYQATLSPDEKTMAVLYSYSNRPWELFVQPAQAGARMRQLTASTTDAFRTYPWRDPEIVYFNARDGIRVPARLYRPENAAAGGPAVIFVHGAGYLQNVHRWWSTYSREFMFHNFLADQGYTVLDIDFRASEGYGRDWRTAIYRHMGGKDLSDQLDGAAFLVDSFQVDPHRIGIYGGSYGGFITLMAMFTAPGTFKCGAALRSVADWAHYNHPYTSNILNTPVEDSIAYRRSSPIYHAEGLQGRLLILHGMVDDNVQFQDVVRLAQRLIELGKENWEMAVFPVEAHGFTEPSSWADEYKRIYKMFEEELK